MILTKNAFEKVMYINHLDPKIANTHAQKRASAKLARKKGAQRKGRDMHKKRKKQKGLEARREGRQGWRVAQEKPAECLFVKFVLI